jgi:hypothetical protein
VPADGTQSPEALRELCRTVVTNVPLYAGHCGWSFHWSGVDVAEERQLRANARAWLTRFPGLAYGDPLSFLEPIGDGLLGVSWLTYVDRSAVESREKAFADLLATLKKHRVQTEVIDDHIAEVQATDLPVLGDRNRNDMIPDYRKAGRALSFLKLNSEQSRFLPVLGMDQDMRSDWYERFFAAE